MNTFQTAAGAAVEATGPVTDAASPEKDWVIRIYRPAIDRKPSETVVKDLGREQDVREVLRWLDANGWILLKNLDLGNLEGEWDVSRDRYVNRIITAAHLLSNEEFAAHTPTSGNTTVSNIMVSLRCTFFAGDDDSRWNVSMPRMESGRQCHGLETVRVDGKDV